VLLAELVPDSLLEVLLISLLLLYGLGWGLNHELLWLLDGHLHLHLVDHLVLLLELRVVLNQTLRLFDQVRQDSLKL